MTGGLNELIIAKVPGAIKTTKLRYAGGNAPVRVCERFRAICEAPDDICATVVKINPSPAPAKQRVLIEIKGRWPAAYEPMSTPQFQPLIAA